MIGFIHFMCVVTGEKLCIFCKVAIQASINTDRKYAIQDKKTHNPRGLIVADIRCTLSSGVHFWLYGVHFREQSREKNIYPYF